MVWPWHISVELVSRTSTVWVLVIRMMSTGVVYFLCCQYGLCYQNEHSDAWSPQWCYWCNSICTLLQCIRVLLSIPTFLLCRSRLVACLGLDSVCFLDYHDLNAGHTCCIRWISIFEAVCVWWWLFHMYLQHSLQAWCLSYPWDGQVSDVLTLNMVGADPSTSFCIHDSSPFCVSGVYDSGPGSMMSVLYL